MTTLIAAAAGTAAMDTSAARAEGDDNLEMSTESGSSEDDREPYGRESIIKEMLEKKIITRGQRAAVRRVFEMNNVMTGSDMRLVQMTYDAEHADDLLYLHVPRYDVQACRACEDLPNRNPAHKRLLNCIICSAPICAPCLHRTGKLCRRCRAGDDNDTRRRKLRGAKRSRSREYSAGDDDNESR